MSEAHYEPATAQVLEEIVEFYLTSGDHNGLPASPDSGLTIEALDPLLEAGMVEVISSADFINPHIRPWPSKRSTAEQRQSAADALIGTETACLYPTALALADRDRSDLADRPFSAAMAAGRGDLELVFFRVDAIEHYRNDPRYQFDYEDFGVSFGIGSEAYLDETEPEDDKIITVRAGFAYDTYALNSEPRIHRYVCAFHRDLASLTANHQQRLKTWEYTGGDAEPHPIWWTMQMGHWPDRIGPFDKVLAEMRSLNELWEIQFSERLFETTDRPRNWGWVLRPSTTEWDHFIHLTDKMLSENLHHAALDAAGAPKHDDNGQNLGTVTRLQRWLTAKTSVTEDNARAVLKAVRDVRSERQRPAHVISEPLTDHTLVARQRDVLFEVAAQSSDGSAEASTRVGIRSDSSCVTDARSEASDTGSLSAPTMEVNRWKRYGKDRLYVTLPNETKVGFWDLVTEEAHPESPEHLPALLGAVERWKSRQGEPAPVAAALVDAPEVHPALAQAIPIEPPTPVALPEVPSQPALTADGQVPARSWIDLTSNRAGDAVRGQARAAREAAPVKSLLARALGVHTGERAWRIGADGEEKVAAQLAKAAKKDPRWQFIHAIPVGKRGSDIDHLVVGPGGVFTVNTKHHPKAKIWVGGSTFMVNGHKQPYIRNSRFEATRAAKLLTDACGFPVHVEGLIATVNADDVTVKAPSDGVHVVPRMQVAKWLLRHGEILNDDTVRVIYDIARRSTTWL